MSAPQQPEHTANERDLRLAKREELMKQGVNPYPPFFDRTHYIKAILDNAAALEEAKQEVKVCGKVYATRTHGGSLFLDIADQSGKIQIYAKLDVLQEKQFNLIRDFVGTGDYIGVHGTVFHTKKGQLSILIDSFEILSKALRSLPGKWYGFKDTEKRYRQRYIDVLLNTDVRERFIKRAAIIDAIRDTLKKKDFLEVDTPTLHPIYGGAHAKPFTTYYESLKRDFYLRISNELYLKRAIIGNFEKVFEFSRDFRNEGIDATHNPEFTMIEIYEAYKDYQYCMQMTKMLILEANVKIGNGMQLEWGEQKIDLSGDWEQISMSELLKKHTGMDVINSSREQLFEYAKSIGLKLPPHTVWGTLVDKIFSEKVEPTLINPTFVIDYPLDISPLAKQHRDNDKLVERFELYIGAKEIANGFSELNDPVEQRKRFESQDKHKEAGDDEAHPLDEDFLLAQEYGMPPTTGVGIGIDRLVMLLTNATTIREVVMFPQLKGEE